MNFANLKLTAAINAYSALRIPLLAMTTPRVVELTETRSVVRVRLDLRTRNHLGVMYFGALCMGAELSIALKCLDTIAKSGQKIDFIFKDFQGDFLKRADGHVHFICAEADQVNALVQKACASPDRLSQTFNGYAVVANRGDGSDAGEQPVMTYKLTLSVKNRRPTLG